MFFIPQASYYARVCLPPIYQIFPIPRCFRVSDNPFGPTPALGAASSYQFRGQILPILVRHNQPCTSTGVSFRYVC